LDDKSKIVAMDLLEVSNKKVMSYQELKQITKVFDTDVGMGEKTQYIGKSKHEKLFSSKKIKLRILLRIRKFCKSLVVMRFLLNASRILEEN
jgi:hypothetical protein